MDHMGNHSLTTGDERPFVVAVGEGGAARQLAAGDPESAFRVLVQLLAESPHDVCGAWGLAATWPEPISLVIRYRPGLVGETRRVAHIVPMRPGEWHGYNLTTWCGGAVAVPDLEVLTPGDGMPCVGCVRRAPLPSTPREEQR